MKAILSCGRWSLWLGGRRLLAVLRIAVGVPVLAFCAGECCLRRLRSRG